MSSYGFCLGCGGQVDERDVVSGGHVVTVPAHAQDSSCYDGEHANCPVPEEELCGPVEVEDDEAVQS